MVSLGINVQSGIFFQANLDLNFALLFSSPRYLRIEQVDFEQDLTPISHRQEFGKLKKIFHDLEIKYRYAPATISYLKDCLSLGCTFIHISSHGELGANLKLKMGDVLYNAYENKGDYLLLEDPIGNC